MSARPLTPVTALDKGVGMLNVWDADQWDMPTKVQTFARATGTGSLERGRGTVHVFDNGTELVGEATIFGPSTRPPGRKPAQPARRGTAAPGWAHR
jgi:serine protease AprX